MGVIQWYIPTNDKDELVKDEFYMKLQSTIVKQRDANIELLMIYLNAKIGSDSMCSEKIFSRWGKTRSNEWNKGESFTNLCSGSQYDLSLVFWLQKRDPRGQF